MGLNFDVIEFCRKLKASRQPPYQCPVVECAKVYRSMCGLQYHLVNYDHDNPNPEPHTPGRKRSKNSSKSTPSGPNNVGNNISPPREALSFEESQRLVQVEIDGRVTRIPIHQNLPYVQPYKEKPEPITERVPLPEAGFSIIESYDIPDAPPKPTSYIRFIERSSEEQDAEVEYDMDEEDVIWLNLINEQREENGLPPVPPDMFELLMDRLEKESYFQMQCGTKKNNTNNSSDANDDGSLTGAFGFSNGMNVLDEDAVCCICMDGECQNSNVILFCDMCNLAVHQDCYGVPYIPEGPWLCRRCLQSPSRGVDCVLCPNSGSGAFKQTDRLHWAHVVCALWIPEVRFANTVFLEPIDSIEAIPAARWKLTCYLCKQRGVGACIQCHRSNCYQAFHVTCAQHAGLYMKMDTVRDQGGPSQVMVQKTAFCDAHTPSDAEHRPRGQHLPVLQNTFGLSGRKDSSGNELSPTNDEARDAKMKKARKILAKKRASVPVISLPTIPPERIQEIASLVNLPKKSQLLHRLVAFWTCKRQYRNGVPLLRRLQSSQQSTARRDHNSAHSVDIAELYRQLKYWQCLRQDLERARLLCELVRKREKLKKEFTKIKEIWTCAQLQPITAFLRKLLDLIEAKDTGEIFTEPVDLKAVPDYLEVVDEPMDLSTMREKISRGEYKDFDSFQRDFDLMINNCTAYNSEDTIFYKAAIKMREQCGSLLRQAKKDLLAQGWDPNTGLFIPGASTRSISSTTKTETPSTSSSSPDTGAKIDEDLNDVIKNGEKMSSSTRLAKLLELLDRTHALTSSKANGRRIRAIKMEISRVRRGRGGNTSDGEVKSSGASNHQPSTDSEREDSSEEDSKPLAQKLLKTTPKNKQEKEKTSEKKTIPTNSLNSGPRRKNKRKRKNSANKSPFRNSSPSGIKIRRNINNNSGNQSDSRSELTDPGTGPETGSGVASLANSLSSSSGNNSEVHTPAKHSPNASPNSTSSSGLTPAQQAQTVSPSGVNRRTAVLFTRKAQAQGRLSTTGIQTLNTPTPPSTSNSTSNSTNTSNSKITSIMTTSLDNGTESSSSRMISNVSSISTAKEISSVNSAVTLGSPLGLLSSTSNSNTPKTLSQETPSTTTRRRVGRPRKNTPLQKKHSVQMKDSVTTLRGTSLESPVETPLSESFRVYRTANEIVVDSDVDESMSESLSSCSECTSTTDDSSEESGSHDDEVEEATSEASGEISSSSSNQEINNKRQITLTPITSNTNCTPSNLTSISGVNPMPPATNTSINTSPSFGVLTPNSTISSTSSPATNKEKNSKKETKSSIKSETSSTTDLDVNDTLEPLSMVWAKCRGYPSYPALIIDPAISKGYMHLGSIPIPAPPADVLALRSRHQDDVYLVLFFDAKRTWQWLPRNKLERFSVSEERDQSKLLESRKPQTRKAVQRAYDHAMNYKQQVAELLKNNEDEKQK